MARAEPRVRRRNGHRQGGRSQGVAFPPLPPPHPVLVHVPIVLLPLGALLATVALGWKREWAWSALGLVLALAAVGAIAAAVAGDHLMDQQRAEARAGNESASAQRHAVMERHQGLGVTTAVASGVLALAWSWQGKRLRHGRLAYAWTAALWVAAVLVLVTGFYGGALAWDQV